MENKTETQGNECFSIQCLILQNLFTKTQDVQMKPFYHNNKIKESESLPREHRINQLDKGKNILRPYTPVPVCFAATIRVVMQRPYLFFCTVTEVHPIRVSKAAV